MAYAASTSLVHTISRFLKSGHNIQIVENSSPEMIKLLEEEARSLTTVLEDLDNNTKRFSSKRLNIALDAQIRDVVFKLEDVVESHLLHQFLSQSQNNIHQQHPLLISIVDIEELKPVIDSLIQTVNKFKAEYIYELSSEPLPKEEEEDDIIVKSEPRMFGLLSNQMCTQIKDKMLETFIDSFGQYALWGMAGIGKTTLARKLFQDPSISSRYHNRAFVKVGPEYELEDVLLDIIKQLDPDNTNHQKLLRHFGWWFKNLLQQGNCVIVLDDVWDKWVPEFLLDSSRGRYGSFKCTLLITTRLQELSESMDYWTIPFLDKKESWDLLCAKVFGDQQDESSLCPPELKKAGKKIAENCEGLPLTILTVANILAKQDITPELWNEVAANKQHSVYVEAYAKMHRVLLPSYYCLSQKLRIAFLYMGLFPQNYKIPCSKLYMLWAAEGFIGSVKDKKYQYFRKLHINSVLIPHAGSTYGSYKTVGLHSSFWYLCKKEAGKCKFFRSCTTVDDCLAQGIETQRRLCIYNPVLFAIKDAFDKIASVSAARSLLCTGMYHKYPVPVCFAPKLLRVLDALIIHFYEFPKEALKLFHLAYFALTCDGDLPDSISKLWNLKFLIVNRRLSIKSSDGAPSYLPVEIWDMEKLEHLQVMGSDLPKPPKEAPKLYKLIKLLDVSPHSCKKRIFESIPNLNKLGIRIEVYPDDSVHQHLGCFHHISHLTDLTSFKCVVVNPRIMFGVVVPPPVPLPNFPRYVHKLTLSGLGYPWEEMSKISSMPKLEVLKLLSYAFRGPKWHVRYRGFPSLEVLVIEDTDLVQWTIAAEYQIENMRLLSMKHCYDLEEIPTDFTNSLEKVEIVDCNPLVLSSANKLKQDWDRNYSINTGLDLKVHSSWDDQN